MIKVDLQKAYDSIEWCFIEQMLKEIGFSGTMVRWIMTCIQSASYTKQVNGHLTDTLRLVEDYDKKTQYRPIFLSL